MYAILDEQFQIKVSFFLIIIECFITELWSNSVSVYWSIKINWHIFLCHALRFSFDLNPLVMSLNLMKITLSLFFLFLLFPLLFSNFKCTKFHIKFNREWHGVVVVLLMISHSELNGLVWFGTVSNQESNDFSPLIVCALCLYQRTWARIDDTNLNKWVNDQHISIYTNSFPKKIHILRLIHTQARKHAHSVVETNERYAQTYCTHVRAETTRPRYHTVFMWTNPIQIYSHIERFMGTHSHQQ